MTRLLLAACFLTVVAGSAVSAAPHISRASPFAVRPGTTVEVTFFGQGFGPDDGPFELWTSVPLEPELLAVRKEVRGDGDSRPAEMTFRLTASEDATVGAVVVRLSTVWGVSEPLLLFIDDLPNVRSEAGTRPQAAQRISTPIAIEGSTAADGARFYRVEVAAGERLAVEVLGQRLGSPIDPVLRLLSTDGRELVYVDDDACLGADCRFERTFDTAGEFLIEVRDVLFREGHFRLRVGDFPLVQALFPLGAVVGVESIISFTGVDAGELPPRSVFPPPGRRMAFPVAARYPGGSVSALQVLRVSSLPQVVEATPAVSKKEPSVATRVELPCALNGRLETPGDVDDYVFTVTAGEVTAFRCLSRSLRSPTNLFLRLMDADGATLQTAGRRNVEDEVLTHEFLEAGEYRLRVRDLLRRGGSGHVYRVEIEPGRGFDLRLGRDRFLMAPHGAVHVPVQARRQGYEGPIQLSVDRLPSSVRIDNATIPAGKNETILTLLTAQDLPFQALANVTIHGHARIEGQDYRVTAGSEQIRSLLQRAGFPDESIGERVFLRSVPSPFDLDLQAEDLVRGRSATVRLRLARAAGMPRPTVHVRWYRLPPGVKPRGRRSLKGKADQLDLSLDVSEEAALGVHDQIFVELEMDLFGEAVRVRSVPLSLRVREPRRRRL